jgi:predicted tellurium resistance membrane protein TerC
MRLGLLLTLSWLMTLTRPLVHVAGLGLSGRDLILLGGGLFLIYKATHEIYEKLEVSHKDDKVGGGSAAFGVILFQIVVLDIVFSLDSVITAVGMAGGTGPHAEIAKCIHCGQLPVAAAPAGHGGGGMPVMIAAMILSMLVMLVSAGGISNFVNRHPSVKILALSFLLLIGVMLVAEGLGKHIEKGYIYAAMAFSLVVELFNMRFRRKKQAPVHLHHEMESLKPDATV